MLSLDALLKTAAETSDWTRVIHRCAWCGRVCNARGEWVFRPIDAAQVTTDGMCPPCGARALKQVVARQQRIAGLAA